ncbi:MAG: NAD-binding protein [Leptolyngbyaceae bacterium]|nr:NAD-binding protein [Leptolyngbyaceae bacterium]
MSHAFGSEPPSDHPAGTDFVLVCGLGSLGQHCVEILKEFGVVVSAIELNIPQDWEIPGIPDVIEQLWQGDCRQSELLLKAGITKCRAILLVTDNERANLEAAFAARLLNPTVRLVTRSSKQNLNHLLNQQLGNFIAFEPTQLSASAFALAAIDENILGFFNHHEQLFQVIQHVIDEQHYWRGTRKVHELNTRMRRVLMHVPFQGRSPNGSCNESFQQFHQWEPNATIQAGDVLITIEVTHPLMLASQLLDDDSSTETLTWQDQLKNALKQLNGIKAIKKLWSSTDPRDQIQRVALICGMTVVVLLFSGTVLLRLFYPDTSLMNAFFATVVLLLGGYGDRFDDFQIDVPIPIWLRLFSLLLTIAGTAFVGVLYALLTEKLLTLRLQFLEKRPPIPTQNHVVVIGMGRVGRRVVDLLQRFRHPLVGIVDHMPDEDTLEQIPLVTGNLNAALEKVNLLSAQSIVAVTEDELQNLELGLMVHDANPQSRLVIRTYDQRFTDRVAQLFPYAQVLCVSALSAEAFVAAAFGEIVLSLFRLHTQTVLVTEYNIEDGDTLNGLLLSDIAYGYGVVPLIYQRVGTSAEAVMPSDDVRLRVGDRLIVLATIEGLKRIEKGELAPRQWQLIVEKLLTPRATFDGASETALISGCSMEVAHHLMHHVPGTLPQLLYEHQAKRLVRKLRKAQVLAKTELQNR